MGFLTDKPMIVRIVPIMYSIVGAFMLYTAVAKQSEWYFATAYIIVAAICFLCLFVVQSRKWYAWELCLASFVAFAVWIAFEYLETRELFWLVVMLTDIVIMIGWLPNFTRRYFDAGA
ncbi:MAG: hypothetical protein PHT00_00055 [Candidatus Methanomethylophilus sp.]|nr:hypothetical protein [Methanomethylophilus sp.]MDD4221650.1 hypothetical protein [Methanomethylophilus sp.]